MNDKQFEALLGGIATMIESIDNLSERVTMIGATIVKVSDPEGWAAAQEAADDLFDDEDDEDEE